MKPVIQTIFSDKDNKPDAPRGNCMRACLASILEIDIDSIPAFEQLPAGDWFYPFNRFLKDNGLSYEGMIGTQNEPPTQKELDEYEGIDGYYMVGGESPRKYVKNGHGVVYYKGKMVHDPHPSGEGLVKVWYIYCIERIKNGE